MSQSFRIATTAGQLHTTPIRSSIMIKVPCNQNSVSYWPLTVSVALTAALMTLHFEELGLKIDDERHQDTYMRRRLTHIRHKTVRESAI